MNRIDIYYTHDHENDTHIIYNFDKEKNQCHLKCSFTSEDPDFGTESISFDAYPVVSIVELAKKMREEISDYLDATEDGTCRWKEGEDPCCDAYVLRHYGEYNNTTLYAVENALRTVEGWETKNRNPKKWYMTVNDASRMVAKKLWEDRTKEFSFCESDRIEAKENPEDHAEVGGWHGIKRIDGFFVNEPDEFIIAVGYYGGGNCGFGYADFASTEQDRFEAVRTAILNGTAWNEESYIYIEEEEKEEN